MNLLGTENQEQYEQMCHDVSPTEVQWWFYCTPPDPKHAMELGNMLDFLMKDVVKIGPFGTAYIMDRPTRPKPLFYDIPLRTVYGDTPMQGEEVLAFVANNEASTILMKTLAYWLRSINNDSGIFAKLQFKIICVQRAVTPTDEKVVVAVDCFENVRPLAYYEHPPNGRLLQFMTGADVPEQSALLMVGDQVPYRKTTVDTFSNLTLRHNERDFGAIESEELSQEIYSCFFKDFDDE